MSKRNVFLSILTGMLCIPFTTTAQKASLPQFGTYYSAQKPHQPALPFNPRPELPLVEITDGIFVFDDTSVDYEGESMMMMASSSEAPPAPGGGSGGPSIPPTYTPTVPIPGVPLLRMKVYSEGTKIVFFNTIPGLVYQVQQTTNLSAPLWTPIRDFVAGDTKANFTIEDEAMAFYRVIQEDDTIQFPDWFDSIYQYMRFDVYTTVSAGTYSLELYADGDLELQFTDVIPSHGQIGVHDPSYDPAEWPNTGYYGVGEWELRVTVNPAAGAGATGGGAIHRIVKRKACSATRSTPTKGWWSGREEFLAP